MLVVQEKKIWTSQSCLIPSIQRKVWFSCRYPPQSIRELLQYHKGLYQVISGNHRPHLHELMMMSITRIMIQVCFAAYGSERSAVSTLTEDGWISLWVSRIFHPLLAADSGLFRAFNLFLDHYLQENCWHLKCCWFNQRSCGSSGTPVEKKKKKSIHAFCLSTCKRFAFAYIYAA